VIIRFIKKLCKFLYDDIRTDIITLKKIAKGKAKLQTGGEKLTLDLYFEALKEYWWVFMLIILAFVCGIFFSSQHYQDKCNTLILEEYIPQIEKYENKEEHIFQNNETFINFNILNPNETKTNHLH